jgi:hypothetical protein
MGFHISETNGSQTGHRQIWAGRKHLYKNDVWQIWSRGYRLDEGK